MPEIKIGNMIGHTHCLLSLSPESCMWMNCKDCIFCIFDFRVIDEDELVEKEG